MSGDFPTGDDTYGRPELKRPARRRAEPEVVGDLLSIRSDKVRATRTGLQFLSEIDYQEWREIGDELVKYGTSLQWMIGDWVIAGGAIWGEDVPILAERLGLEEGTIHTYTYVASKVHFSIRVENLSFGHHRLVAPYSDDREFQRQWLQYAADKNLSVAKMREDMQLASGELPQDDGAPDQTIVESPLANKDYKRTFNRIFKAISMGSGISPGDVRQIRQWLDDLEQQGFVR